MENTNDKSKSGMFYYDEIGTTLMLMKSYRDILGSLCKSAIYEVGMFSQFTREERLILAEHLDVITTIIDKKLKEITASAEK